MAKQKVKDFVDHAKYCALNRASYYDNSFPANSMQIHPYGVLSGDCIGFIKGLINDPDIWQKTSPIGYYAPIGKNIGDIGEREIWNQCTDRSTNFSKIPVGAYLEMDSRVGHGGLHVGDFYDDSGKVNVIECTVDFGGGITTSFVDQWGRRWNHEGGYFTGLYWERHGMLTRWVDYSQPTPTPTPSKGRFDGATVLAAQEVLQKDYSYVIADGYVDGQEAVLINRYVPTAVSGVWRNMDGTGSLFVRAIQEVLKKNYLYDGQLDGVWGFKTSLGLQKFLNKFGYGLDLDGIFGELSTSAYQDFIQKIKRGEI